MILIGQRQKINLTKKVSGNSRIGKEASFQRVLLFFLSPNTSFLRLFQSQPKKLMMDIF
jgi:hypothetical protein